MRTALIVFACAVGSATGSVCTILWLHGQDQQPVATVQPAQTFRANAPQKVNASSNYLTNATIPRVLRMVETVGSSNYRDGSLSPRVQPRNQVALPDKYLAVREAPRVVYVERAPNLQYCRSCGIEVRAATSDAQCSNCAQEYMFARNRSRALVHERNGNYGHDYGWSNTRGYHGRYGQNYGWSNTRGYHGRYSSYHHRSPSRSSWRRCGNGSKYGYYRH